MNPIRRHILAAALALAAAPAMADNSHGTADEAVAMVQKVIAAIKADGLDKVLTDVNDIKGGKYRDRDLYITINDLNGKNLAHGANPRMQGKDLIALKDADGKPFMKERIDLARSQGKGWQDYKFVNPTSGQIEPKSMYFERHKDVLINCGIYKSQ